VHVVIVTGLSGSGKSTAIRVLEDLGFYCIDNLPVVLTPKFIELCQNSEEDIPRVALGIDLRERAFLGDYASVFDEIRRGGHRVEILYLDAADDVLVRRFSETRRPHPLAEGANVAAGIARERQGLAGLKGIADRIIDTSAFTVHQLRDELRRLLADVTGGEAGMRVLLLSFGYKYGLPTDTDIVLDVRFLPNPFFVEELRALDGTDPAVARYVMERTETQEFLVAVVRPRGEALFDGRSRMYGRTTSVGRARRGAAAAARRPRLPGSDPAPGRESLDMIGIVLVGHGALAPEALHSIETVLGHPVPNMVAVGAALDDTLVTLRAKISAAAASVEQGDGTIILTDMYGDTATNVSMALAREARIQVVTGSNLPIVVKAISARHEMNLEDLASFIVAYGRDHILRACPADADARTRNRK
jgi:UPF0042 nucleotide-binding protein